MSTVKITADNAVKLADQYSAAGDAIWNFEKANWKDLSQQDKVTLGGYIGKLHDSAQHLITYAVGKYLDDTQAPLAAIKKATDDANATIKTLQTVKQVIEIATSLVTLAGAIYSGNVGNVPSALQGVIDAVKPPATGAAAATAGGGKAGNV